MAFWERRKNQISRRKYNDWVIGENMFKNNKLTTYGIIGLGRFGKALAMNLAEAGAEILVIDKATIWGYRLENGKSKDKEDHNKEDRMEE